VWEAASWPHAAAVASAQSTLRLRREACTKRELAASSTAVQANADGNGRNSTRRDAETPRASERPPTVDPGRDRPSLRRNPYNPNPPTSGWSTIIQRIAAPHGSAVNRAMAGRYIQPDCGSAAKGNPPITWGFHAGMCPAASAFPRKQ